MLASFSLLYSSIAAVLAPLWSMVIFSGVPHWSMALRRKRAAALRSRLAVRRKSTVCPALSTARYILPLSLDADVRLVHAPARTHRALALPDDLIQHGRVLEHPAIQTGIGVNAALLHHFLQLPIADGINPIPTDTPKDDVPLELVALEIPHRSLRPLRIYWKDIQSRRNLKLCDRANTCGHG